MRNFIKHHPYLAHFWATLGSLSLVMAVFIPPSRAAEKITLKLGLIEQSVPITTLENFAATGELAPSLQPYRPLLTEQVQTLLKQELGVNHVLAQQFLEDLFNSSDGEKLLKQLQALIPNSTPQQIQRTLKDFLARGEPINILNLLRAYPQPSVQLDLVALGTLMAALESARIPGQILSSSLAQALAAAPPDLKVGSVGRGTTLTLGGATGCIATASRLSTPASADPSELGTEMVYREFKVFQDKSRHRSIAADLYIPAHAQGPIAIMSHGFAADRHFLKYLAYHLASHGITVVTIEHPGSNIHALVAISQGSGFDNLLPPEEFIDRPKDISFVLDRLEKLNQAEGYGRGKFKTEQVTVIGHSFGGYTALALAGAQLNPKAVRHFCQNSQPLNRSPADWLQCAASALPYRDLNQRDPRVVSAILLNPIIGDLFAQDLDSVKVPILMLSAGQDGITPIISHQLRSFQQLKGEKYLLLALGATHLSVTDISYWKSVMGQSTLVREVMDERAEPLRKMMRSTSLAFIQGQSPAASFYQAYLSPNYVQSLSTSSMALRLTRQLPPDIAAWLNLLAFHTPPATVAPPLFSSLPIPAPEEIWASLQGLFAPRRQKTGYLEPIFSTLLQQYYQDNQGLS